MNYFKKIVIFIKLLIMMRLKMNENYNEKVLHGSLVINLNKWYEMAKVSIKEMPFRQDQAQSAIRRALRNLGYNDGDLSIDFSSEIENNEISMNWNEFLSPIELDNIQCSGWSYYCMPYVM
jgi:hypothetical protein